MSALLLGLLALVLAVVLTPVAMAVARRTGVVDHPGPLKPQAAAVPYLGGAAVLLAATPAVAVARPLILLVLGAALALGVADDVAPVAPWARLLVQCGLGAAIAALVPTRLGEPFGGVAVAAAAVLLMNGVNLLDGLDALAGGVMAAAFTAAAVLLGGGARLVAVGMAGGLLGFLVYNRPPARVYLGDGGAYLLGAAAAVLLASAWAPGRRPATSVAALLLVAVPAAEVAFAVLRRARAGHSLAAGDRRHPYDLLVTRGWRPARSALAYATVQVVLAAGAVGAAATHSTWAATLAVAVAAVALVALAARYGALRPGDGHPA